MIASPALDLRAQNPPPTTAQTKPPVTQTPVPPQTPVAIPPAATAPPRPAFEKAWEKEIEAKTPVFATATADLVFVGGPTTPVVARRAGDGEEAWRASFGTDIAPIVADNVLILSSGGAVHAYDLAGTHRWQVDLPSSFAGGWLPSGGFGMMTSASLPVPVDSRPAISSVGGMLLIASGRVLRAWRASDGTGAWTTVLPAPIAHRVAGDEGRVFAALHDRSLVALDLATGTAAWRRQLETLPGPLTAAADQIYFGGADGACYAYRQRDGEQRWYFPRRPPAAGVAAGDAVHAYFVLLTNEIIAFDRESGNERWDERFTARLAHGIKSAGGALFIALGDGTALMFQAANGAITTVRPTTPPAERGAGVHFEAFDVAPDGAQVYALTELALKYTLSAYRRK